MIGNIGYYMILPWNIKESANSTLSTKKDHPDFVANWAIYENLLQVDNKGYLVNVAGDGNCGFHSLILGLWNQNLSNAAGILGTNNPSLKLHQKLQNQALCLGIMTCLLEQPIIWASLVTKHWNIP